MRMKLLVFVFSFCLVAGPYQAQAGAGWWLRSDEQNEGQSLAIIYGGTFAIAMTLGAAYFLIRGEDDDTEPASLITMIDGQRFQLIPYSSEAGGHGMDLEFHLSDDAMIGFHARYGSVDGGDSGDNSYFGGVLYRLSF